jgi:putative redox protein
MTSPDREYIKDDITIEWRASLCTHCGECITGLPQVFNIDARPWVNVANASKEQIVEQVNKCPSKALQIR